ncbi:metallophosphoesterase family protein [Thermosulfuriphilus sp.]
MEGLEIGVISDTHVQTATEDLRELAETYFLDCPVILHAGDMTEPEVLSAFEGKKIYAVCGNMDSSRVAAAYPQKQLIEIEGYRIGLVHGWGGKTDLEQRLLALFPRVDVIVYGHSHVPVFSRRKGVCFFNPGSFSPFSKRPSFGLLRLGKEIKGRIIYTSLSPWR